MTTATERYVKLTQVTDDLSDVDDRDELPAGDEGKGSVRYYEVPEDLVDADEEAILDWFHGDIPIGCLEDFEWEVTTTADDSTSSYR